MRKTFLEIATKYPVAALQRFGLVRTPTPPWVGLHRVLIPQHSLDHAAAKLVEAFGGEDMAYKVAGGTKWWQVRAGSGVEAEWIIMKKDWKEYRENSEAEEKRQAAKEATDEQDEGAPGEGECEPRMSLL